MRSRILCNARDAQNEVSEICGVFKPFLSNLRGISDLWDILWVDLLCFDIFFNVFFYYIHRDFRFRCKTPDDFTEKITKFSNNCINDFKPETEISIYEEKTLKKNVKTQEVKPIHNMFKRPEIPRRTKNGHFWTTYETFRGALI